MRLTVDIKKYIQIGGLVMVLVTSIAFSFGRQGFRTSQGVQVVIDNTYENYFVEKNEITELMNGGERDYVTGSFLNDVDLRQLEINIEKHPYVEDAQVYRDLRGVISVEVKQKRPIARIFSNSSDDFYITESGEIVPESDKYTARVPLVEMDNQTLTGAGFITKTAYGNQLFKLLSEIQRNEFWKAQIASLTIDKHGEITIQPQVTRQIIDFGYPEKISEKLKKLRVFYKEILPAQGWNSYDRVSVKYDNQIICE